MESTSVMDKPPLPQTASASIVESDRQGNRRRLHGQNNRLSLLLGEPYHLVVRDALFGCEKEQRLTSLHGDSCDTAQRLCCPGKILTMLELSNASYIADIEHGLVLWLVVDESVRIGR